MPESNYISATSFIHGALSSLGQLMIARIRDILGLGTYGRRDGSSTVKKRTGPAGFCRRRRDLCKASRLYRGVEQDTTLVE